MTILMLDLLLVLTFQYSEMCNRFALTPFVTFILLNCVSFLNLILLFIMVFFKFHFYNNRIIRKTVTFIYLYLCHILFLPQLYHYFCSLSSLLHLYSTLSSIPLQVNLMSSEHSIPGSGWHILRICFLIGHLVFGVCRPGGDNSMFSERLYLLITFIL